MIERTFYCDWKGCGDKPDGNSVHVTTVEERPRSGFLFVTDSAGYLADRELHFCCWQCLMQYAADQPIPEVIEL